jgi:hypothetical protein
VLGVIQEIDIGRVAVLMVKLYSDDAEANADRRADELETEGDQAGAAIWRRVTVAIEQLTNLRFFADGAAKKWPLRGSLK